MPSATLIPPPPEDPSKSPIENVLALTPLSSIGPDIFTNTRELWHPPGARGVYGGAVIAQCLSAAQATIPPSPPSQPAFLIHSMHCYFVLAGDASIPILYHVERVRDGRSFVTRTVQARQRGKCIFTTTASFMREGSAGRGVVEHGWGLPEGVREGLGDEDGGGEGDGGEENGEQSHGPFVTRRLGVWNNDSPDPHLKKAQQWIRSRGPIPASSGPQAHLVALAYMSDSWFIGTVARVHALERFGGAVNRRPGPFPSPTITTPTPSSTPPSPSTTKTNPSPSPVTNNTTPRKVGMMVSLDHIIYFHHPREVRVDEWMCSEMESPWAGEGRGLVMQRIWSREGRLLASCVQEGLVRLVQDDMGREKSKL